MTSPKAIETHYAGCRFRSRLEARWAVFFDTLRILWEYEPQGFEWGDCEHTADELCFCQKPHRYLPDFHLPNHHTYVEVKGSDDLATLTYKEMLSGAIDYGTTPLSNGLLLLGPIPDTTRASFILHSRLKWSEGVELDSVAFCPNGHFVPYDGIGALKGNTSAPQWPDQATWEPQAIRIELPLKNRCYGMPAPVRDAYVAARSARFEHGETPTPKRLTLGAVVRQPSTAVPQPSAVDELLRIFGGSPLVEGESP